MFDKLHFSLNFNNTHKVLELSWYSLLLHATESHENISKRTHTHTQTGTGSVFQNWGQFRLVMKYLSEMTDEQTLVMYSGHPLGVV